MAQQKRRNKAKARALPRVEYDRIKRAVLGAKYDLSIVVATPAEARALNKKYRKKSYIPDVLAFPLSDHEGEVVLNAEAIAREAALRKVSAADYAAYIFLHACVHLKGFDHSDDMTDAERKYLRKLELKDISDVL
ncbi:MAG: rRNA maturation RNase YbeY [Parcubacteria group bacterium]|nr:rRNA maturation RNase YbeY [Parcubacteria group bacterium]